MLPHVVSRNALFGHPLAGCWHRPAGYTRTTSPLLLPARSMKPGFWWVSRCDPAASRGGDFRQFPAPRCAPVLVDAGFQPLRAWLNHRAITLAKAS